MISRNSKVDSFWRASFGMADRWVIPSQPPYVGFLDHFYLLSLCCESLAVPLDGRRESWGFRMGAWRNDEVKVYQIVRRNDKPFSEPIGTVDFFATLVQLQGFRLWSNLQILHLSPLEQRQHFKVLVHSLSLLARLASAQALNSHIPGPETQKATEINAAVQAFQTWRRVVWYSVSAFVGVPEKLQKHVRLFQTLLPSPKPKMSHSHSTPNYSAGNDRFNTEASTYDEKVSRPLSSLHTFRSLLLTLSFPHSTEPPKLPNFVRKHWQITFQNWKMELQKRKNGLLLRLERERASLVASYFLTSNRS